MQKTSQAFKNNALESEMESSQQEQLRGELRGKGRKSTREYGNKKYRKRERTWTKAIRNKQGEDTSVVSSNKGRGGQDSATKKSSISRR